MTVLEGLHYIKENLDPSLAWRYSCRMGVCGSCGMLLNGRPTLACNTQILDIAERELTVGPLPNFEILRDLVPDLMTMFDKHRSLMPFVTREDEADVNDPAGEYYQSPEELEHYLQFSFCIRCGCCMAACPTLATDASYLGPMPLAQAHRWNQDTRDGARSERSADGRAAPTAPSAATTRASAPGPAPKAWTRPGPSSTSSASSWWTTCISPRERSPAPSSTAPATCPATPRFPRRRPTPWAEIPRTTFSCTSAPPLQAGRSSFWAKQQPRLLDTPKCILLP